MTSVSPDEWVTSTTIAPSLLTAPPGCGKTEHLAKRAAFLVSGRVVNRPQQILALTYSNKATANLSQRLREYLGPGARRYVEVTNFHRFGFRLIRHHGPIAGYEYTGRPLVQAGSVSRIKNDIARDFGLTAQELSNQVRAAKRGPYDNAEVLERMEAAGRHAAIAYEVRLRAEQRLDFDDAIRLGLLIAREPSIANLYRARFPVIMVDEAQDLSELLLDFVECIGSGTTTFAGDRAQGIFGFAGAAPAEVYKRIVATNPTMVELTDSFRSAPAILRVVSWSSVALGGGVITAAKEANWSHDGEVVVERFASTRDEADWVHGQVGRWLAQDPRLSIGVMVRAGARRRWLDEALRRNGYPAEFWDYPAHRPTIVGLLRRFVGAATREAGDGPDGLDALYLLCFETLSIEDTQTMDELVEAIEGIRELVMAEGLTAVVRELRHIDDPNQPAPPGLHLLNGHLGKGQQFDKVIVLGMEDGHIPSYRATSEAELLDELAVLHVMTSRARTTLVFTVCRDVRNDPSREWIRQPSRWLGDLSQFTTG